MGNIIQRVRGAALTSVKEVTTEGLLPLTSLPPSIHSSTILPPDSPPPPNRRCGGRVVEGWMEGGRMVDGRRPLVMASLTKVRAVPWTLMAEGFGGGIEQRQLCVARASKSVIYCIVIIVLMPCCVYVAHLGLIDS